MIAALFLAALACDGRADDSQAWTEAVQRALSGPDKTIELPAGDCILESPPTPLTLGVSVRGQGKSWTVLHCRTPQTTCLAIRNQGTTVRDLTIYSDTWGGVGIHMTSTDAAAGGNHVIEHVWITGGTWAVPLYIEAVGRTQPPLGVRAVILNDVSAFNATVWGAVLWDCIACEWRGGGVYQGSGTTQAIAVGGRSVNVRLDALIDLKSSTIYPGTLR